MRILQYCLFIFLWLSGVYYEFRQDGYFICCKYIALSCPLIVLLIIRVYQSKYIVT